MQFHKKNNEINEDSEVNRDILDKQKYHNNQYSTYYKQYKNNKITNEEFLQIKAKLKYLKTNCKTREEFEFKFNQYKKALL